MSSQPSITFPMSSTRILPSEEEDISPTIKANVESVEYATKTIEQILTKSKLQRVSLYCGAALLLVAISGILAFFTTVWVVPFLIVLPIALTLCFVTLIEASNYISASSYGSKEA
jgi:hypothetical protein